MNAKRDTRLPKLRKDKNRGFVELNGRRHYLGAYNAPDTREKADRLLAEWLAHGRRLPTDAKTTTVVELCRDYLEYAETYYRKPDGTPTSSMHRIREAIRSLRGLYGSTLASDFNPVGLRTLQHKWIDKGLARKTINDYVSTVHQIFEWGAGQQTVPITTSDSLRAVKRLKAGRSPAKESRPRECVEQAHIDALKPHVSRQVWALIRLQLLTGARSGELVGLRPVDFNVGDGVWTVILGHHKTSHHGKRRALYFNAKAQGIVKEFMADRAMHQFLFSPREAERERYDACEGHRRPGQPEPAPKSDRKLGDCYTTDSYRRSICRACDLLNEQAYAAKGQPVGEKRLFPVWTPHQLRHTAATRFRREFGLELTQRFLGHSRADITEIYAEVEESRLVPAVLDFDSRVGTS